VQRRAAASKKEAWEEAMSSREGRSGGEESLRGDKEMKKKCNIGNARRLASASRARSTIVREKQGRKGEESYTQEGRVINS